MSALKRAYPKTEAIERVESHYRLFNVTWHHNFMHEYVKSRAES